MIQQTPWFERKFDFSFSVGYFPVILERLRGTIPHLENLLNDIPEQSLSSKIEEKWSVKEQIGHLYDLEPLWYDRIEDFIKGKKFLREADLSNRKTDEANHNKKTLSRLLQMFSSERNKLIERVKNINETTAALTSVHPRLHKPMRMIDLLFFVAEHDDHHLAVIRTLISAT